MLRLATGALGPPEVFVRPFAYVLSGAFAARVPDLAGLTILAVITRRAAPLDRGAYTRSATTAG